MRRDSLAHRFRRTAFHRTVKIIGTGSRHDITVGRTAIIKRSSSAVQQAQIFNLYREVSNYAPFNDSSRLIVCECILVTCRIAEGNIESAVF